VRGAEAIAEGGKGRMRGVGWSIPRPTPPFTLETIIDKTSLEVPHLSVLLLAASTHLARGCDDGHCELRGQGIKQPLQQHPLPGPERPGDHDRFVGGRDDGGHVGGEGLSDRGDLLHGLCGSDDGVEGPGLGRGVGGVLRNAWRWNAGCERVGRWRV
jgi:hypothetical protein